MIDTKLIAIGSLVAVALASGTGYGIGKKVERSGWLERVAERQKEIDTMKRDIAEKQRQDAADERAKDMALAATQAEIRRIENELERQINAAPLVKEVMVACENDTEGRPGLFLPDIAVDARLFNCAIAARDCNDLPDPAEAVHGDERAAIPGRAPGRDSWPRPIDARGYASVAANADSDRAHERYSLRGGPR